MSKPTSCPSRLRVVESNQYVPAAQTWSLTLCCSANPGMDHYRSRLHAAVCADSTMASMLSSIVVRTKAVLAQCRSAPESAAAEAAAWAHERPAGPPGWACPKCRAPYTAAEAPREYRCFCGKVADPPFDPWAAPHSCGVTCGRPLLPACGHACVLLCHPGPCPPCPAEVIPCLCMYPSGAASLSCVLQPVTAFLGASYACWGLQQCYVQM